MIILLAAVVVIALFLLYRNLLAQSQHPVGLIGKWMMKLWNRVYLPMVAWSIGQQQLKLPKKILDVGVGNGASSNYLARNFPQAKFPASIFLKRVLHWRKKILQIRTSISPWQMSKVCPLKQAALTSSVYIKIIFTGSIWNKACVS